MNRVCHGLCQLCEHEGHGPACVASAMLARRPGTHSACLVGCLAIHQQHTTLRSTFPLLVGVMMLSLRSPAMPPHCCILPAVIKDFCKQLGVDNKQVQGVIRLAKKNGEWLGFLA